MDDLGDTLGINFNTSSLKDTTADSIGLQKAMEGVETTATEMESRLNRLGTTAEQAAAKSTTLKQAVNDIGGGDAVSKLDQLYNRQQAIALQFDVMSRSGQGAGKSMLELRADATAAIDALQAAGKINFNQNTAQFGQMLGFAADEAKRLSQEMQGVGNSTSQLSDKQQSFLSSLRTQADTLGKTKTEILAYKAAELGLSEHAAADIQKIKAFADGVGEVGEKTRLTSFEMVVMIDQLKQFAEQIISGGNPLKAAAQQGLGAATYLEQTGVSAGNAAKQVIGDLGNIAAKFGPLIIGAGLAAAAIGAVTFALIKMHEGAEESAKIMNSLAATGDAAGITANDFYKMADAVSQSTGQSAKDVRELELAVVQTGQVTGDNIRLVTEASENLSKATGVDAKKAFEQLLPLFGNTSQAAAKLNEQYHFLTGSLFDQIQALEAQGRTQEAAALAMNALENPIKHQVENLGILESTWKNLKFGIDSAIDSMMKWGRIPTAAEARQTTEKTLDYRIAQLRDVRDNPNSGDNQAIPLADRTRLMHELTGLEQQRAALAAQDAKDSAAKAGSDQYAAVVANVSSQIASGPSAALTELNKKKAFLTAALAAPFNMGFNPKELQEQLKYVETEIDQSTKKFTGYHAAVKGAKEVNQEMVDTLRNMRGAAKEAQSAIDAYDLSVQKARAGSAEKTTRDAKLNSAMESGDDTRLQYLNAENQVLNDNKDVFDAVLTLESHGVVLDQSRLQAQQDLLKELTAEELQRRANNAAAQAAYDTAQESKTGGKLQTAFDIGGVESYDLEVKILDVKKQYANISDANAAVEARRRLDLEKGADALAKQAAFERSIGKDATVNQAGEALNQAYAAFWPEFLQDGKKAASDFGKSLKSIILNSAGNALADAFSPVLKWFGDELKKEIDGAFTGVKDAIQGALENVGVLKKDPVTGQYKFDPTSTGGQLAKGAFDAYAGYQVGSAASSALGGNKTAAQQQNSQAGAALGAALGSVIPGVGTLIGSIVGSALGGLLGPSKTWNTAEAKLTAAGTLSGSIYGDKRTDETTNALQDAINAITASSKSITDLGGKLGVTIQSAAIGNLGSSYVDSSGKYEAAAAGSGALANAAAMDLLKNATFANDALNKIKDGMVSAGASFDDTYKVLSQVNGVLNIGKPALSQWQQQLKDLNDALDPLIASTSAYDNSLQNVKVTATKAISDAFDKDISKQLLAANSNVAGQYADMLETQVGRLDDAKAVGGNLNNVLALNAKETDNFVTSLEGSYSSITDLSKAFDDLRAQMVAAGQDTANLDQAFANAKDQMRSSFDQTTADGLLQASNATLYNLEQMLKTQKARVDQATALGANLAAVDRENAVETSNFFKNLSATEKAQLGDYLGLIEDYTGKIGVVGSSLIDALDPLTSGLNDTIKGLQETSSNLRDLAQSVGDTSQAIKDKYSNVTPLQSLDTLRTSFKDTAASAIGGDQAALGKLSDLANTLIQRSRDVNGSTTGFSDDYKLVTSLLDQAQNSATKGADAADAQVAAAQAQVGILTEIRNILNDPNPQLDTLSTDIGKLSDSFADVKNLGNQLIGLYAAQAGATLSDAQLQALSMLVSSNVANNQATTQAVAYAGATTGTNTAGVTTASTQAPATAANDVNGAAVAGYFQSLQAQLSDALNKQNILQSQMLELQRQLLLATKQNKPATGTTG